jgi:hypothetical protein
MRSNQFGQFCKAQLACAKRLDEHTDGLGHADCVVEFYLSIIALKSQQQ